LTGAIRLAGRNVAPLARAAFGCPAAGSSLVDTRHGREALSSIAGARTALRACATQGPVDLARATGAPEAVSRTTRAPRGATCSVRETGPTVADPSIGESASDPAETAANLTARLADQPVTAGASAGGAGRATRPDRDTRRSLADVFPIHLDAGAEVAALIPELAFVPVLDAAVGIQAVPALGARSAAPEASRETGAVLAADGLLPITARLLAVGALSAAAVPNRLARLLVAAAADRRVVRSELADDPTRRRTAAVLGLAAQLASFMAT